MGKHRIKPNYRRRVLRLPDLDHCKLAVLNSLGSPASRRVYEYAIDQFIAWYCSEPRLAFNVGLAFTPCDRPPHSGEQTGSIIEDGKMWRLWVGPFDYGRRLRRIVAACGQDTVIVKADTSVDGECPKRDNMGYWEGFRNGDGFFCG